MFIWDDDVSSLIYHDVDDEAHDRILGIDVEDENQNQVSACIPSYVDDDGNVYDMKLELTK